MTSVQTGARHTQGTRELLGKLTESFKANNKKLCFIKDLGNWQLKRAKAAKCNGQAVPSWDRVAAFRNKEAVETNIFVTFPLKALFVYKHHEWP